MMFGDTLFSPSRLFEACAGINVAGGAFDHAERRECGSAGDGARVRRAPGLEQLTECAEGLKKVFV